MNPEEIFTFLYNEEFYKCLDKLNDLIEVYFPNCLKYMKFDEDPMYVDLNSLIIYIINGEKSFDENYELLNLLERDLIKSKSSFPKVCDKIVFFARTDDKYCKEAMACYEKHHCF